MKIKRITLVMIPTKSNQFSYFFARHTRFRKNAKYLHMNFRISWNILLGQNKMSTFWAWVPILKKWTFYSAPVISPISSVVSARSQKKFQFLNMQDYMKFCRIISTRQESQQKHFHVLENHVLYGYTFTESIHYDKEELAENST